MNRLLFPAATLLLAAVAFAADALTAKSIHRSCCAPQENTAKPLLEKIYADHEHLYHDQVSYWTLLKVKLLVFKTSSK